MASTHLYWLKEMKVQPDFPFNSLWNFEIETE